MWLYLQMAVRPLRYVVSHLIMLCVIVVLCISVRGPCGDFLMGGGLFVQVRSSTLVSLGFLYFFWSKKYTFQTLDILLLQYTFPVN